jgi:hypothetical protein
MAMCPLHQYNGAVLGQPTTIMPDFQENLKSRISVPTLCVRHCQEFPFCEVLFNSVGSLPEEKNLHTHCVDLVHLISTLC